MLGKLIKYEFKATRRMLLLYALLFVLAAATAVIFRFSINANGDLFVEVIGNEARFSGFIAIIIFLISTAYVFMNAFIFAAVLIDAINRFRSNLLGDEGYLMHTLPLKTEYLILSKNVTSVVWTISGIIAALLSYLMIGAIYMGGKMWKGLIHLFSTSNMDLLFTSPRFWSISLTFILLTIISISELYFRIHASMAVGYSLKNHRAAASIGIYIVLSIAKSIPHNILLPLITNHSSLSYIPWRFLIFEIVYTVIWCAIYYFISAWFLNKRLNLQ